MPGVRGNEEPTLAEPAARRAVPAPVVLIAAVQIIGGTIAVLAAGWIALATLGGPAYTEGINLPPGVPDRLGRIGGVVGGGLALGGLVAIGLARKLQRGRQWARVVLIVASAVDLVVTLYLGLRGAGSANALFGVVVPVLYLIALNTTAVRAWFSSGAG